MDGSTVSVRTNWTTGRSVEAGCVGCEKAPVAPMPRGFRSSFRETVCFAFGLERLNNPFNDHFRESG